MRNLIIIILNMLLIFSTIRGQTLTLNHHNGKIAWNGTYAYYDNGKVAWNGNYAYHDNGKVAWNGNYAYNDNGSVAWNGNYAYYENGKVAWNGNYAYHSNGKVVFNGSYGYSEEGKIIVSNLISSVSKIYLFDLETSEIQLSPNVILLTKTLNKKTYVVGYKIHLSGKNTIIINNEKYTKENIISLNNDINFLSNNGRILLKVMGQKVYPQ